MFAKLLKEYRNQLHYTQEELAAKLDISVNHLSRIELGKVRPSGDLIIKILDVCTNDPRIFNINTSCRELYGIILIAHFNSLDDSACRIAFTTALQIAKCLNTK